MKEHFIFVSKFPVSLQEGLGGNRPNGMDPGWEVELQVPFGKAVKSQIVRCCSLRV